MGGLVLIKITTVFKSVIQAQRWRNRLTEESKKPHTGLCMLCVFVIFVCVCVYFFQMDINWFPNSYHIGRQIPGRFKHLNVKGKTIKLTGNKRQHPFNPGLGEISKI